MANNKISTPKLAIVIHTEEEFDWDNDFYRSNNQVTHGAKLISFCEQLIALGAKITFALDYAFVTSNEGKNAITHFQTNHKDNVEFATHLHPWVNPPFADDSNEVANEHSYPGNLNKALEFEKLSLLTDTIEKIAGVRPSTYLAGRYGIGINTHDSLKKLGYRTDISISPFTDFTHQLGPDFSRFNNKMFEKQDLLHWPHTTAILSVFPVVEKWFDRHPEKFESLQKNALSKILLKILRVKKQRLSPEGFELSDLKKITKTQLRLGHENLIFSFHSPSVQAGLTPYVATDIKTKEFYDTSLAFISWFIERQHGKIVTVEEVCDDHRKGKV